MVCLAGMILGRMEKLRGGGGGGNRRENGGEEKGEEKIGRAECFLFGPTKTQSPQIKEIL